MRTAPFALLAMIGAEVAFGAEPPAPDASSPGQDATPTPVQQVVVRGQKVRPRLPPKDRGVAGSMVQGAALRAPGKQAAEVLRTEPGVAVVETGGQGSMATASIRGATSSQTPVYLAGIRLNDDVAGTADLSLIPLWLIQRVEVYRGNAPIEADQLGIGGAVFFEPVRPRKPGASAGALAGSYGARGLWAWGSAGSEASSVLLGARVDRAHNDYPYLDDRGTRFDASDDQPRVRSNADAETLDAWMVATTRPGTDARIDIVANAVQREQGVPGLSLIPTQAARSRMRRGLAAVTASVPCDREGACLAQLSSSALAATGVFDDPLRELALSGSRVELTGRRVDQAASVRIDATDRVTLVPSLRGAVERLLVDSDGVPGLRASRIGSRAAMGAEWRPAGSWALRSLAAGECQGTSQSGQAFCTTLVPSGRIGAEAGAGGFTFLANLGRYARVPTLGELYGIAGAVRGNPDLAEEQGVSVDVGARAAWKGNGLLRGAFVDLFGFVRTASDLIAWRRSSLGYVRPYNVAAARISGLELLSGVGVASFLDLELAATLLDPRDTSDDRTVDNDILPFRSRLVLAPAARLHTSQWASSGVDDAALELRYVHQSSRYADAAGLVVIPAQGSLDIESSVATFGDHLSFRLRLANALDEQRYDVVGYPLPGRAWYGATEVRW